MAFKLSVLAESRSTVEVQYDGNTAAVTYRPSVITPAMIEDFEETDDVDTLTTAIEQIVETWDVLDDEGEPIPPAPEHTRHFPTKFLNAVLRAVLEDMQPGEQNAGRSGGGSRRRK